MTKTVMALGKAKAFWIDELKDNKILLTFSTEDGYAQGIEMTTKQAKIFRKHLTQAINHSKNATVGRIDI